MRNTEGQRLEWLDTLRGFAALGVAAMHCFETLRRNYPDITFFAKNHFAGLLVVDFVNLGKVGVVVFFFISGYLIPFSLANKDLRQFAITRFFRLYPAYWFSILLSVVIIAMPPLVQLLANITMFQKFAGIEDINGVYWTLQIELVFYFVCAMLFYRGILYDRRTIVNGYYLFLACSLLLAGARYFLDRKLPVAVPLGLAVMFLGMMTRKCFQGDLSISRRQLLICFGMFVAVLLPVCFLAYNKDYGFDEKWYRHFVSYILAILFFFLLAKYRWHNRVFAFLGSISYSLYLLHTITGVYIAVKIREHYPDQVGPIGFVLLFLLFSLSSSTIAFYLIEKPSIALGRSIINKRKRRKAALEVT